MLRGDPKKCLAPAAENDDLVVPNAPVRLRCLSVEQQDWILATRATRKYGKSYLLGRYGPLGSALTPKLLGSYECELHPLIERLIARGYDDVIDVGCAEGYYATGMAMRLPQARVHAYDTSETARALCSAMVKLNGVAGRVSIQTTCTPETLITFPKPGRTLVIVDCESYEKVLFTPSVCDALKGCDVLIEMHDFLDVTISTELEALFAVTHQLTNVLSTDDIQKAKHYQYPELEGLSVRARFQLLAEGRPMIMEWLLAEAR